MLATLEKPKAFKSKSPQRFYSSKATEPHTIFDNLYRLTSETVQLDPANNNGTIGYSYDAVGNRQQRTSSITPAPAQSFSYDANDRLTSPGYGYDANGSTTTDPNGTYSYAALGRLTSATVNGVTSTYVYISEGLSGAFLG